MQLDSKLPLNPVLQNMDVYASKAISKIAKQDPDIVGLSFGEPEFGPPQDALKGIVEEDLSEAAFLDSAKRYEDPRGSLVLRQAIAAWYKRNYNMDVCPEREVMVTHGGVEAITLSILCTTAEQDKVIISDPSYMLYERTIATLGRQVVSLRREAGNSEYIEALANEKGSESQLNGAKTMIINSPENPSGYVLSQQEWEAVGQFAQDNNLWVVHDEVYDTMAFEREHLPARNEKKLHDRAIMINSFSKKFGIPGLRIGWLVANEALIELAAKAHDYLYLGVNIQYEKIATRLLNGDHQQWLQDNATRIERRAMQAVQELTPDNGFSWTRPPLGAMFLFPDISGLYHKMPQEYRENATSVSAAVAKYLLEVKKVAVVPGNVYGEHSDNHVRMVLCSTEEEFQLAMTRLKTC
jgi:aspartate/methionine/tyrosine aminotransferase